MRSSINISDLLTYSDIYGLGMTAADVTMLSSIDSTYADKIDAAFYFKPTSKAYDITLEFSENGYGLHIPHVSIVVRIAEVEQIGYPCFGIKKKLYCKFLPKVADAKKMALLADLFNMTYEEDERKRRQYATMDDFKKSVMDVELKNIRQRDIDSGFIEACYWAADQTIPADAPKTPLKKDYEDMPGYIQHITHVLQLADDTRVAFFVKKKEGYNYGNYNRSFELSYNYYVTIPGDAAYNWTDVDRYFSHYDKDLRRPCVMYTDAGAVFPREHEIVDAYRRGQPFITIDNSTLAMLASRWMRKQQELTNEVAASKALVGKLSAKIEELDKGKEFSYNDMTFKKNGFEYEGQEVSVQGLQMSVILKKFSGNFSEEHLNFDRLFETWISSIHRDAVTNGTTTGKLGAVDFNLVVTTSKTKAGVTNQVFRVNGCRINKDEVVDVLTKAICFPATTDFDQFCKSVSECSLRYHKMLAGGVEISVYDEIFGEKMEFKINLEREKNKNFISFNGKRIKVGDTNRLLTLLNARQMSRVINVLLDQKAVGMTGEDIKLMLETGKKTLIDQRNREKDLLDSTIKMFGIEKIEDFKATNGKYLDGYLIRGKLRNYVVEEEKCMVYEHPTGRYICMVDRGQNEHSNVARMVNRFFALSNDSKLAKEISTL